MTVMSVVGQAQTVEWAQSAGGRFNDDGFAIAVDASGNSHVTGDYTGTATFGPFTLTSSGPSIDIFVAKYDVNGNVLWARSAGGTSVERSFGIGVDAAGNCYATGEYEGTATFGSFSLTSAGDRDIFVVKYDSGGNVLWARSAGGTEGLEVGNGIAVDAGGNSHVTGDYQGTATFGPFTLTSAGSRDIFVAKYDNGGNVIWARSAGGGGPDRGFGIDVDSSGNSYVTGGFRGGATFGSFKLFSTGSDDIFVAKYDASGDVLWARSAGGTPAANNEGRDIAVGASGNSYVIGNFGGTIDFDGQFPLTSLNSTDIFVAKYDTSGDVVWAQSAGGPSFDGGSGIALGVADDIFITGFYYDTGTFGPFTLTSAGTRDIFVAKCDAGGTVLWARSAGGISPADFGNGIGVDAAGNAYGTGAYGNEALFGTITLTAASRDIFVAKYARANDSVPTVSQWGLMVMALLLLAGAKLYFDRRRATTLATVDYR